MSLRKILWIILGFILLPVVLAVGFLFFGIIAMIILGIVVLIAALLLVIYLNRRFKQMMYHFRTKGPAYTEEKVQEKKHIKHKKKNKR